MCVNQKCMAVGDLRAKRKACPYDCNGNGMCNNKGNCHCKTGYSPPYCDHPGPGGSDDSGPASSPNSKLADLKLYLYFSFVLAFQGIYLVYFICQNCHIICRQQNLSSYFNYTFIIICKHIVIYFCAKDIFVLFITLTEFTLKLHTLLKQLLECLLSFKYRNYI